VDELEEKPVRRENEGDRRRNSVHGVCDLHDPSSHHSSTGLSLRMFGPLDVRVGNDPLPALRSRRGYWLLALLTLRHEREVEREWLASTLWPESAEMQSLASLRRTLTDLRSALGIEAWRLASPTPHTLRLNLEDAFADVIAFDGSIEQGNPDALARALSLYRGPLLEGCLEEWALAERESREQSCLEALELLGRLATEKGDFAAAIKHLRHAVTLDPLRESAHRALMEALAADGDHAAVALAYREVRDRLRRDINAEPTSDTVSLFRKLQEDARLSLASVRAPTAVPKDSQAAPGYLPRPFTTFIGREKELEQVERLLAANRLVTITGTGGVGKTRLAIRAAEEPAPDFSDGVWFIDLAPIKNASLVAQAVARVFDVRERPNFTLSEALCDSLRDQNLLLILDNCEHVIQETAELAQSLVEICTGLRILATSRQPLGVAGEVVWRAPSLEVPEPRNLPPADEGLAFILPQYAAARLFVERAASALPTFALSETTAPATLRIIRRLDGIPLAIELAAARIRVLSAQQIAARLDDRFRLLTRGNPAAMPRQQTLQAAIDWSYELLTEEERSALRKLAVFSGGWTLEVAEETIGDPGWQILDVMSDLIDKSLVVAEDDLSGEWRYRMLETVREYALERLRESGEEPAARKRHFDYFLKLAEEGSGNPSGDITQYWLDRLEIEHDNVRAALQHAPSPEHLARLTRYMYWFWNLHGHWHEAQIWLDKSLEEYRVADIHRAKVLSAAGVLSWRRGDYDSALQFLDEAFGIYQRENDIHSVASMLGNMGLVHGDLGDYRKARECHEQSLKICRELGDRNGVAARLTNLGLVALYESDYPAARGHLSEAIAINREIGVTRGLASCLANLGLVLLREGDLAGARKCNEECVAMCRELSFKSNIGYALHGLGMISAEEGDNEAARTYFRESLAIRREIGEQKALADALTSIGDLMMKEQNYENAVRLWAAGTRVISTIGARISPAEKTDCERNEKTTREAMGQDTFEKAWAVGHSWSTEQALDEAVRAVK
jgi:predicted ATPase/DNA-binding SARP family transcriptional activator